jgi:hypothetical protein
VDLISGGRSRLPRCENLASRIHEEAQGTTSFTYLDAPQLLKHMLGLATAFGPTGFDFLYLWYEVSSLEAKNHHEELEEFKKYIRDEVRFHDMTYQQLFEAIREYRGVGEDYISYLAERYFPRLTE